MKTDDLVAVLAAHATPTRHDMVFRRFAVALAWGVPGAALLLALTFGFRSDLAEAARLPMFWLKLTFAVALAVAGLWASLRLSRPGMRLGAAWVAVAAPVAIVWLLAAWLLVDADPSERTALLLGSTWQICPTSIALISSPMFAAAFWAMKGLAPTRLALAGAGAGLLAGAVGAALYALYCPELAAPFIAVWYVAGMALVTLAGALLGPRLLRW